MRTNHCHPSFLIYFCLNSVLTTSKQTESISWEAGFTYCESGASAGCCQRWGRLWWKGAAPWQQRWAILTRAAKVQCRTTTWDRGTWADASVSAVWRWAEATSVSKVSDWIHRSPEPLMLGTLRIFCWWCADIPSSESRPETLQPLLSCLC